MTRKLVAAFAAGLLLTACAAAPSVSVTPGGQVATETGAPVASPTAGTQVGALPAIPHLTAEEAKARQDHGENFLIVDVRAKTSFENEHIEGAVNHPWATLAETQAQLPKDRTLLLYCTCPDEHSSAGAAGDLQNQYGFTRLLVLKGGMQGWQAKGYATVKRQ